MSERGGRFVRTEHILEWQRMRGRRDVARIQGIQNVEVLEDLRELLLEASNLLLAEADAREPGDVKDFVSSERHADFSRSGIGGEYSTAILAAATIDANCHKDG